MTLHRITAIFLRQLFLFRRSAMRIFSMLYWATLEIFLWGVITVYLNQVGNAGLNFVVMILGVVILWNFLVRIQHGITVPYLEDIWTRNFMNLFSSPLSINEYITGHVLIGTLTTALAVVFLGILSWLLFAYNVLTFGFLLIPFLAALFIFGVALGILTTAMVLRFGPASEFLAWSLPMMFSPLSGVFHPISALPEILQPVSKLLPSAYVFEGMRSAVLTGAFDAKGLLIALALALLYGVVAYAALVWSYRYVLRHGMFTRFLTD